MATALPSSGDVPSEDAGCDPSDLLYIHDAFRRLYALMPAGVRGTSSDRRRVAQVAQSVRLVHDALHHHHVLEDNLLWDSLKERRPACTVHVELMKHHHAEVAELLRSSRPLLDAWEQHRDRDAGEAVAVHLETIGALLEEHLAKEERFILPVIEQTFTEEEWEHVGEEAQKGYARSQILLFFGLIQDSMTPDQLDEFLTEVPRAIKLLYRLYGNRSYARNLELLSAGTARPGHFPLDRASPPRRPEGTSGHPTGRRLRAKRPYRRTPRQDVRRTCSLLSSVILLIAVNPKLGQPPLLTPCEPTPAAVLSPGSREKLTPPAAAVVAGVSGLVCLGMIPRVLLGRRHAIDRQGDPGEQASAQDGAACEHRPDGDAIGSSPKWCRLRG